MNYELVVGMEVHTELKTESKVFCGCSTKFGAEPNTHVCPICLGMPGVLPVLNKKAFELSVRAAIALNCEISEITTFDRKNYYYPDLPKNYQISQQYQPLGKKGWLEIDVNGTKKTIHINNIHLEEDAGKNIHPEFSDVDYSLVDLNRAGMALLEIVTEPDLRSIDEVVSFMNTLKNILQYTEVSDCKMEEGSLRFEANISLREEGSSEFGKKVEIKNLNSMKTVVKTIEYEIKRQTKVLNSGGTIAQETRLWDDVEGVTRSMRSKEGASDYRYFPDPDLVEVHVSKEWQEEIKNNIPELREAKKSRFIKEYDIPEYDAGILTDSIILADYFEKAVKLHNNPKAISNWIMTEILREIKETEQEIDEFIITPAHISELISLIDNNTISGKIAKSVFAEMVESGKMPKEIVKEKGLVQITDESAIEKIIDDVIAQNSDVAEKVRSGNKNSMGFLVGQVMRLSKGKANPALVNKMLEDKLSG